jgi:hypothetical protein
MKGWLESSYRRFRLKILTRFGQRKEKIVTTDREIRLNAHVWCIFLVRNLLIGSRHRRRACGEAERPGERLMIPGIRGNLFPRNKVGTRKQRHGAEANNFTANTCAKANTWHTVVVKKKHLAYSSRLRPVLQSEISLILIKFLKSCIGTIKIEWLS